MSAARPRRRAAKSAPRRRRSPAEIATGSYEKIALVLQGGGALGAYQAGVYEALEEAGLRPDWFAGVSIGAINAAILAGNAPERRVERLRTFWDTISLPAGPFGSSLPWINQLIESVPFGGPGSAGIPFGAALEEARLAWLGATSAVGALLQGQQGFFQSRALSPFLFRDGSAAATSFYDVAPLRQTLERLVDFDRINDGATRLSVGAVNVRTGNVVYFDSREQPLGPEHVIASGALPPAFPAVEIDGEHYWDGGVVSNTPLQYVLSDTPRADTLALQVDLWSARGELPRSILDVLERQKDIQYSSRTRLGTDTMERLQKLRSALRELIERAGADAVPAALLDHLQPWICDRVYNVIHLIYRSKPHEEPYKDYAFGPVAMRDHWQSGLDDMRRTLAHVEYFDPPSREQTVVTHDVHRDEFVPRRER